MPTPRYTWFLAHASPDAPAIRALYDALTERGVACFLDRVNVAPGDEWELAIPHAQQHSAGTLVFVSRHYNNAWYLRDEVHTAIRAHRAGEHRVIPILLDGPVDPMPYGLTILQALDLRALGRDALVDRLVELAERLQITVPAQPRPASRFTQEQRERLYGALITLDTRFPTWHEQALRAVPHHVADQVPHTARATPALRAVALVQAAAIDGDDTVQRLWDAVAHHAPRLLQ